MEDNLLARARALADAAHDLIVEHRELLAQSDLLRRQLSAATSQMSPLKQTAGLLQQLAAAQHIVGACARHIIRLRAIVPDLEHLGEREVAASTRDLLAMLEQTQAANVADRDRLQDELRRLGRWPGASTISIDSACRISFVLSYAGSKSTKAASKSYSTFRHQMVQRDQDHRPNRPVLGNIVQALVERTIAWLNRCRRLAKDWENLNRKGLAFLRLASIRLMLRKLCNPA